MKQSEYFSIHMNLNRGHLIGIVFNFDLDLDRIDICVQFSIMFGLKMFVWRQCMKSDLINGFWNFFSVACCKGSFSERNHLKSCMVSIIPTNMILFHNGFFQRE